MRSWARKLVTLLLIALLAMPAMSSPGLRHRHANGDKSHRHDVTTFARHEHSHARGATHSHSSRHRHGDAMATAKHSHDRHVKDSAQVPVEHAHVFLLGIEFSIPIPQSERSDTPQPIANAERWIPLISEVSLPKDAHEGTRFLADDLFAPVELMPRWPARSEVRPLRDSAEAFLCDTARRERSGVLII